MVGMCLWGPQRPGQDGGGLEQSRRALTRTDTPPHFLGLSPVTGALLFKSQMLKETPLCPGTHFMAETHCG